MTASERVSPARLVPEGTRKPAHQPIYTSTHLGRKTRVDCACGWHATGKTWAAVEHAFAEHLIERATRRAPRNGKA